jgi:phosphoribosylglycinamide formyltransferase-1
VDIPAPTSSQEVVATLHQIEHQLLPQAVRLIAAGAVSFDPANPRRVVIDPDRSTRSAS